MKKWLKLTKAAGGVKNLSAESRYSDKHRVFGSVSNCHLPFAFDGKVL